MDLGFSHAKPLHTYWSFLRGEKIRFGYPAAENRSNILRAKNRRTSIKRKRKFFNINTHPKASAHSKNAEARRFGVDATSGRGDPRTSVVNFPFDQSSVDHFGDHSGSRRDVKLRKHVAQMCANSPRAYFQNPRNCLVRITLCNHARDLPFTWSARNPSFRRFRFSYNQTAHSITFRVEKDLPAFVIAARSGIRHVSGMCNELSNEIVDGGDWYRHANSSSESFRCLHPFISYRRCPHHQRPPKNKDYRKLRRIECRVHLS